MVTFNYNFICPGRPFCTLRAPACNKLMGKEFFRRMMAYCSLAKVELVLPTVMVVSLPSGHSESPFWVLLAFLTASDACLISAQTCLRNVSPFLAFSLPLYDRKHFMLVGKFLNARLPTNHAKGCMCRPHPIYSNYFPFYFALTTDRLEYTENRTCIHKHTAA